MSDGEANTGLVDNCVSVNGTAHQDLITVTKTTVSRILQVVAQENCAVGERGHGRSGGLSIRNPGRQNRREK